MLVWQAARSHWRGTVALAAWWVAVLAFALAAMVVVEPLGFVTGEPLIAQLQLLSLLLAASVPVVAGFLAGGWFPRLGVIPSGALVGAAALTLLVLSFFVLARLILLIVPSGGLEEYLTPAALLTVAVLSIPVGALLGGIGGLAAAIRRPGFV